MKSIYLPWEAWLEQTGGGR